MLLDPGGEPIKTYVDQQKCWLKQFADIEGGIVMSKESLQQMMPSCLGLPAESVELTAVPSIAQLTKKVRKIKRGKAPGPDGIPPDIIKAGAGPLVQHLSSLTTKIALQAREPDDWRGGRLVPLHKGKSPKWDMSGYRSIFINNVVTKLYHSSLRDHLATTWSQAVTHIQFGERVGCSTDTPHLLVQEHLRHATRTRTPSAALFVDFQAAFYSVIRQGLFSDDLDDRAFISAMFRFGIKPHEVERLLLQAKDDFAVKGVSQHV